MKREQRNQVVPRVDEFLAQHPGERNTIATLRGRLRYATNTFGDVQLDRFNLPQLGAWRRRLPPRSGWHITKALRQVLHYAVACRYVERSRSVAGAKRIV